MNEEPNVGHPHDRRDRYDELLPVPNGDADDAHERLPREDSHVQNGTYLRRTIKSDAPEKATDAMT